MKAIVRRVGRLEDRFPINSSGKPKVALRIFVSLPWKGPANLATSTCTRMLNAAGGIIETVKLDGDEASVSPDELEKFIASFPIQTAEEITFDGSVRRRQGI